MHYSISISEKVRFRLIITALIFLVLVGIGAMLYPMLSSIYSESVQSEIHSQYQDEISNSDAQALADLKANAQEYNRKLFAGEISILEPEKNGYFEQLLAPNGSQIMAYIQIPKIHVNLPVFHGVGSDALDAGCGHMPQSSLPIGGQNTHSVISAHTGMASAAMFSDLPLLKPGDTFSIQVLGETITYEIQSESDIQTVLPVEVQAVQLKNGEDLCTLVTCVPFGVNSHRLLVTGHRIPTPEPSETLPTNPQKAGNQESLWKQQYLKSIKIGLCILIVVPLCSIIIFHFLSKKKGRYENTERG